MFVSMGPAALCFIQITMLPLLLVMVGMTMTMMMLISVEGQKLSSHMMAILLSHAYAALAFYMLFGHYNYHQSRNQKSKHRKPEPQC